METESPKNFESIIADFTKDLTTVFPEYAHLWSKLDCSSNTLHAYCLGIYPERFFDILYSNADIFAAGSKVNVAFLPGVDFRLLYNCEGVSENTRNSIWKYLQLITFAIVGTLNNKEAFGDTAKMFEAINEDEFKSKLEETLSHMQGLFEAKEGDPTDGDGESGGINMPDAEQLHGHITGMLDGKLGQLAREIAEETAANLNADFEGATDMKDVFQTLVKNPTKLMGLVKTVGDKLDSKIKSGDLKESELIAEASEMMNKMKNMPGMGNIQSMLSKMGMGDLAGMAGLGGMGGGKVNMGAMQANLDQRMKLEKTKERIRAKADSNARAKAEQEARETAQMQQRMQQPVISDAELFGLFGAAEKAERTPRGAKPPPQPQQPASNGKKKKGKK